MDGMLKGRCTRRAVVPVLLSVGVALAAGPRPADAPPPDRRSPHNPLKGAKPSGPPPHVFLIYPTTNSGFAYVLEEGKGLTELMMRESWKGPATRLYAMKRTDFAAHAPKPNKYPHGDDDAIVAVVDAPPAPPRALKADAEIEYPEGVPLDSPVVRVEKVFRISALTSDRFELTLVRETETTKDGRSRPRPRAAPSAAPSAAAPPPTKTPAASPSAAGVDRAPSSSGCRGCAAARGESPSLGAFAILGALAFLRRRERPSA